jgi:hypothetical protein
MAPWGRRGLSPGWKAAAAWRLALFVRSARTALSWRLVPGPPSTMMSFISSSAGCLKVCHWDRGYGLLFRIDEPFGAAFEALN